MGLSSKSPIAMQFKSVPYQALLLTLVAVAMELAAGSHFRGAIVQWRPLDPINFDGRVSATLWFEYWWCKCAVLCPITHEHQLRVRRWFTAMVIKLNHIEHNQFYSTRMWDSPYVNNAASVPPILTFRIPFPFSARLGPNWANLAPIWTSILVLQNVITNSE